jgi:hypothetical protein
MAIMNSGWGAMKKGHCRAMVIAEGGIREIKQLIEIPNGNRGRG